MKTEKVFSTIGGVRQGMFIRSKHEDNPVLLFLHGGPCFSTYFLAEKIDHGLEDSFTVCYWEQRGGGLSYNSAVTIESMTLDQLSSDAIEVTQYLRERFRKNKICLLAHSGGTTIALSVLSKAPELYHAYIAIAQITNQRESEKMAYNFMLAQFEKNRRKGAVKKLGKFKALRTEQDMISFFNSGVRDESMHKLGIGTMRNMKSIFRGVFLPVWKCRAYTFKEKASFWKSKLTFIPKTALRLEILNSDYPSLYPRLEVPVFFMSGKYDYTVNVDLSYDYFTRVLAPLKQFFLFESSAHSPIFEEPSKFREIIEHEVLKVCVD